MKQKRVRAAERSPRPLPPELANANKHLLQPLTQAQLLQMQQEHGNNYVQQFLARVAQKQAHQEREEDDREVRAADSSAKLAEANAYSVEAEAMLSSRGVLEMNVERLLDMKRYSHLAKRYRHVVQGWRGSAVVDLEGESFKDNQMRLRPDGQLRMNLGKGFCRSMEMVDDPKLQRHEPEMGYERPFKAKVRATMHYRSQDPKLREGKVGGSERRGSKDADERGLFLKLEVESVYVFRVNGERQEKALMAEAVFDAEM